MKDDPTARLPLLVVLYAMAGLFLIVCAVLPPPWWPTPSPFQRIVALVAGLTACANTVAIVRDRY